VIYLWMIMTMNFKINNKTGGNKNGI